MLVEHVDLVRIEAGRRLTADKQAEFGQFMTPAPTAALMASMFEAAGDRIRLLDAGAAVGSLTAAWVSEICGRKRRPQAVELTAYEIDVDLASRLEGTLKTCERTFEAAGISCQTQLRREDFIESGVRMLAGGLFGPQLEPFDAAILNPPYRKVAVDSKERQLLKHIGVETSNLYSAFLAIVLKLLAPGGEIVAITPRSFCNGPYFKPFRQLLIDSVRLKRVHVFESRASAFREDRVLQENIIFHGTKGASPRLVEISSSAGPEDDHASFRLVPYDQVVRPDDPEIFIHLAGDSVQHQIAEQMRGLPASLGDLGLTVSTGRVVDFRATHYIRQSPGPNTVPLIYPTHFDQGFVRWPKASKKPNAIELLAGVDDLLIPSDTYVLVKRFSAKEERRRIVAAVYDPARIRSERVGFENHLNYFHVDGQGLAPQLANGLAVFLNSTIVDLYFRQFNGHTQVNAADLRSLRFPAKKDLLNLGIGITTSLPGQDQIDDLVQRIVFDGKSGADPVKSIKKMRDALHALRSLDLPPQLINERSALTLLSLLDLKPSTPWSRASNPLLGITPMMDFFAQHYGKQYKPNTRESVRRQTVHHFLDAGLVIMNPDQSARPTNSPRAVYQIEPDALQLLRSFGTPKWDSRLRKYLASVGSLRQRYARDRQHTRIPLTLAKGKRIMLSAGGQNALIEHVIRDFCDRFTPGGHVVYVGDTAKKFAYFDCAYLNRLGVSPDAHGKMPDVVVHHKRRRWLVLIEAVTSHGPVDPKRRAELKRLFKGAKPGLVFVTAFLDRKAMTKYLRDISWETEVWIADRPDHLIHFNGDRFLGPHAE